MTRLIDVLHLGRDRVIGAYDLDGVIVDPGPASCVETLLAQVRPRALLLTHIHLDHAGATGVLVRRFPDIQVYVHEVGAPHVVDPSKLLKSAARLYGEENMEPLWGEVAPVPEENVHTLSGGETVEGCRVEYAPGHASHHVVYLHEQSGDLFTGDACGVRIPPRDFALAPTPPPDVDLDAWRRTLDMIESLDPRRICMTHFGTTDAVGGHVARIRRWIDEWCPRAAEQSQDEWVGALEQRFADEGEEVREQLVQATPPDQQYLGLERYWRKRAEREQSAA